MSQTTISAQAQQIAEIVTKYRNVFISRYKSESGTSAICLYCLDHKNSRCKIYMIDGQITDSITFLKQYNDLVNINGQTNHSITGLSQQQIKQYLAR
jgi:hypothetical protein